MNPAWFLRAKRWAQNSPSMGRVKLVVAVVALCLLIVGAEWAGLVPDWISDRPARPHRF